MSLPDRYGKQLQRSLGAVAVWMPGTPVPLGTIMAKDGKQFEQIDVLSSFTNVMQSAQHQDKSLDLVSKGTRQRIFQANAELPSTAKLDLMADATLKYEFSRAFEYVLKTPTLKGEHIININQIAAAVISLPTWQHNTYYLVHETYMSDQFSFVGTENSSSDFEISGKGSAILGFLSAGASVGLTHSGNVDVKILGAGGSIAMGLVRILKNGSLDFVP